MKITFLKSEPMQAKNPAGPTEHVVECDEFVQITYDLIRTGPDGDTLAWYDNVQDTWRLKEEPHHPFSDIVIEASA